MAEGPVSLAGVGHGTWLLLEEQNANHLTLSLQTQLKDLVSIADLSDASAVLRLTGAKIRNLLAKLLHLDVHSRAFEVGKVAATSAAHISVTVWRLPDDQNGWPVFEVLVPRSLALSFGHLLSVSSEEYVCR
jgi:sarcosine oxidase subunit gamma